MCRTDPADVARVESKTFIVTKDKYTTVPHAKEGAKGGMGQWMDPDVMHNEMEGRFRDCMAGEMSLDDSFIIFHILFQTPSAYIVSFN